MNTVLQACAYIVISCIICITLSRQGKDISVLLSIAVCVGILLVAATFLQPIIDFLLHLQQLFELDRGLIKVLLQAAGIAVISEIVVLVCQDSNQAVLGKAAQILATAAIVYLSIPLFTQLVDLLEELLSAI